MTTVESRRPEGVTGAYVYGIVAAALDVQGLTGLDQQPLSLVAVEDVAAVIGEVALERPPGRRADLMAHSAVVDSLAGRAPVVPVQFGSFMRDAQAVREELLEPRLDHWRALLAALRDRRQFNLKARYDEASVLREVVSQHPEIAELRARTSQLPDEEGYADRLRLGELVARALEAKRQDDTSLILDAVIPHVVSYAPRERGGVDHLLDVAFLVDDRHRGSFEQVLEDLAEAMHERVRMQLVGPVPPYDFVEGDWWV